MRLELAAVTGGTEAGETGVSNGDVLIEFADASVAADASRLDLVRQSIIDTMGAEALVDCAGVVALFEAIDRVADATGQPVETEMVERSAPIRAQLGIDAFAATKSELDSDTVNSNDGSNGQ